MEGADSLKESLQRLAGFEGAAAHARLPIHLRNPQLVARDLRAALAEIRRLQLRENERQREADALIEAFTNAAANLDDDEFATLPPATRKRLSDAFTWLERRLVSMGADDDAVPASRQPIRAPSSVHSPP